MKQMKRFFVILAGIACFSGICFSDQSGSLVVSPGSDVSWSCVLEPYETATLTITVAPAPSGYRLKEKTVTITSSSPDFCWGGGYSVVNSALISATTRVTVSCVWEPIPGEGGGGAGAQPPNLYGSATGAASAQPGEYWNVAGASELAVGDSVVVNAYKDDNEPAPSSWSISGPATISGAGASATVQGTAPSAAEYDVIVHSVCNETGQSDDELLTVVGVESIEAEPEVVCVDGEVSYTITTQPEGYNYMVEYEPADTSTPGSNNVVAYCGTSSATCTVTVIKVETETEATVPSDRTRKKLGVGEKVTLTLKPTGLSPITWAKTGDGTLSATSGNPVTLTAHDRASSASVTATYKGVPFTVSFTVVEPSGAMIEQEAGTGVWHIQGEPSVGFMGRAYELPADVSFYNIETQEGSVNAVATGYFAYQNGLNHAQGPWVTVGDVVAGKGSREDYADQIQGGSDNHTPYEAGTFTWAIPWSFRVGSGTPKVFATVNHVKTIDATGKLTISKGGTTKSAELNDPTSDY